MSKDNSNIAISVSNLSKRYLIGKKKDGSLRGTLANLFKSGNSSEDEFWALKNINFEIEKGDVIGIIGKNGAGKSTLLKVLSQITRPTTGRIEIDGRVASLLEVGTGFHPELTGRENIFLNGTILGMTRKEVQAKFDEIVAFSGVEKFLDTPVKRYSSGMYVRLAFSVAAHLEPEILIIDEVLAVGDAEFQKKCLGKMQDVAGQGRTVLFVSHQIGSIRQLCNKGILLRNGQIHFAGDIGETINKYQSSSNNEAEFILESSKKEIFLAKAKIDHYTNEFYHNQSIPIFFKIGKNTSISDNVFILVQILNSEENVIFSSETKINDEKHDYSLTLPSDFLVRGEYKISTIIYHPGVAQYDNASCIINFSILDNSEIFTHLETFNIGSVYAKVIWG